MVLAFNRADAQLLVGAKTSVKEQLQNSALNKESKAEKLVNDLLNYASKFKGTRYRRGSSSPKGFDCSGFTSFVYGKFGYDLNRSSSAQVSNGEPVELDDLQPGDLVFFNGRAIGKRIGHVGIVTKVNNDQSFEFIHSACGKGVTVSKSEEAYYSRRYMGACRVIND